MLGGTQITSEPDRFTHFPTTTGCSGGRRLYGCRAGVSFASQQRTHATSKAWGNCTTPRALRPKCSNCWRFCPGNQREWQCHRALVRRHRGDPKLGVIPACCRDLWAALAITCYISNGVPMKVGLYIGADMNWRAR